MLSGLGFTCGREDACTHMVLVTVVSVAIVDVTVASVIVVTMAGVQGGKSAQLSAYGAETCHLLVQTYSVVPAD